jgi:YD repeat-containing protein
MKITYRFLSLLLLFTACKKDNDASECTLKQVKVYSGNNLNSSIDYEYDDQGRIRKIVDNGSSKTFTYYPDSVVVTGDNNNPRTTYFLNNNGLAVSSKTFVTTAPAPMNLEFDHTYSYDPAGFLVQDIEIFSQPFNGGTLKDTSVTNYIVSNGNIEKAISIAPSGNSEMRFEYSALPLTINNSFLNSFPSGAGNFLGKHPGNLVAKITDQNGNLIVNFQYGTDSRKNIVHKSYDYVNQSQEQKVEFSYQCR